MMSVSAIVERVMRMGIEARQGLGIPELWSLAERQLTQNKKRQPYATLDAWFNDTQLRYALLKEQDRPLVVVRVDSLAGLALLSWSHNGMPYVRKGA